MPIPVSKLESFFGMITSHRRRARSSHGVAQRQRSDVRAYACAIVFACGIGCGGAEFSADPPVISSAGAAGASAGGPSSGDERLETGGTATRDVEPGAGQAGSKSNDNDNGNGTAASEAGAPNGSAIGGAGGAGGSAGGAPPGGCKTLLDGPVQLAYFPELSAASTQEIHPFFEIGSNGQPVTLDRISIRYYYTNESTSPESATCYWVTGDNCSLVSSTFHDLTVPTATATRYLELRFPKATKLSATLTGIEVRVGFTAAETTLRQTNDYSFDSAAPKATAAVPFPYQPWVKVTLYVDDQLVWGSEPCPDR